MKPKLTLSLILAVILIGGALFIRFFSSKQNSAGLVAVNQPTLLTDSDNGSVETVSPTTPGVTDENSTLTNSDKLGRNMLLDYVDLASSGQATDASVKALANKYVDLVPNINLAPIFNAKEVVVVSSTKENLLAYGNAMITIEKERSQAILKADTSGSLTDTKIINLAQISFAAYTVAIEKLKKLSVPTPLVNSHTKLINVYLSIATSMKALSTLNKDTSSAFAGIIKLQSNLDFEQATLKEISQILTQNGV
ncbi:hypothetical protein BH11PAT3_BH11PAT3_2190 [soil metagenome]